MNEATAAARAILDALVAADVREVVLAPGSRNAPLAFAAHDAHLAGRVRLHTRIDERTAGFLALGLTRVGARAAVMCTSGTAVANLHPAVLEAAHTGLPLVLVSADRPASLRGTGANQTTDQVRIFGPMARFVDLAAADLAAAGVAGAEVAEVADGVAGGPVDGATGGRADPLGEVLAEQDGPVHLNVQFTPPLVPDPRRAGADSRAAPAEAAQIAGRVGRAAENCADSAGSRRQTAPTRHTLGLGPRTVVVAGDDAGPPARTLAESANWPLLAEPTSGSRTGGNALRTYRLLLDGDLGRRIERVVVAGHPTLSRPVTRLLEREDVEVVSVPHRGIWHTRPFRVDAEHDAVAADGPDDPAWLAAWQEADRRTAAALDRLLAAEPELTPHEVAGAVSAAVPPDGMLLVGASSPIRDLDLMARPYPVGERRKVLANRGLAGIDGTISTAIGAALGRPHGSRNLALVGDVTFLHDANGLVLGPDETEPELTVVVVNDDGGSIFTMLEQGASEYAAAYDRLFGTPHGVDLAALCAATRTPYWRVGSLPELEQALRSPNGGIEVVEVRVRRDNRRELDQRIRALVE